MNTWEYKVCEGGAEEDWMNELGAKGWELVSSYSVLSVAGSVAQSSTHHVFKRNKEFNP